MKHLYFILILLFAVGTSIFSQELPEISIKAGGTLQTTFSYSETDSDTAQMGFGLRRFRVYTKANIGKSLSGFAQFEGAGSLNGKPFKVLDARIQYDVFDGFNIRVGRFLGAGMRGAGLTFHYLIDLVERPVSAIMWGARTVGSDYRSLGVEFMGTTNFGLTGKVFIHNGDGNTNIIAKQAVTSTNKINSFAVDMMAAYKPMFIKGAEIGGHFGKGNKYINDYLSYSFYIYQSIRRLRFKAEYVTVINRAANATDETFYGYYLFGGYSLSKNLELMARYELVNPVTNIDENNEKFYTLGAAYCFYPASKFSGKITGAYVYHDEQPKIDNNTFSIMFQLRYEM